jgi:hypothetical protein
MGVECGKTLEVVEKTKLNKKGASMIMHTDQSDDLGYDHAARRNKGFNCRFKTIS